MDFVEDEAQTQRNGGLGSTTHASFEIITVVKAHCFIKANAHCFIKGISDAHHFGCVTSVSPSCVKRCHLKLLK